jgi:hypothetical protein
MLRATFSHPTWRGEAQQHHSGWASAVAIAFAMLAAISFAIDITMTLSASQAPLVSSTTR